MERSIRSVNRKKRERFAAKHPDIVRKLRWKWRRESYLRSAHGMAYADYLQLMAIQRGRCAICELAKKVLAVDHCHTTERVRGLLCVRCNLIVGLVREDPSRARAWKNRRIRRALVRYIEDRCIPAKAAGPVRD